MSFLKVAIGSIAQHKGTDPAWSGPARSTCDYNAISVPLQLLVPTGTDFGNNILDYNTILCLNTYHHFMK